MAIVTLGKILRLAAGLCPLVSAAVVNAAAVGTFPSQDGRWLLIVATADERPLRLNAMSALHVRAESSDGHAVMLDTLEFEATMPQHRHGMVVVPRVVLRDGQAEITGVKLHMPGEWQLRFRGRARGEKIDVVARVNP